MKVHLRALFLIFRLRFITRANLHRRAASALNKWSVQAEDKVIGATLAKQVVERTEYDIQTIVEACRFAERLMPGTRCLRKSIAICEMLRARGLAAQMKIGVEKRSTGLAAHAWVQLYDRVIGDDAQIAQRFLVMQQPRLDFDFE